MKVYIAGPMSGHADLNYPAFFAAEADWQAEGWEVLNPARNFPCAEVSYPEAMRKDLLDLVQADAIALLPGWERSKGALFEKSVAEMLGLPMHDATTFAKLVEPSETVCQEADRLVSGDRGASYGHPLDDYSRTAAMMSAIIGAPVTAHQAILCMIAVKLSRETHKHKRDNLVDIAGYAKCAHMAREEEARRA